MHAVLLLLFPALCLCFHHRRRSTWTKWQCLCFHHRRRSTIDVGAPGPNGNACGVRVPACLQCFAPIHLHGAKHFLGPALVPPSGTISWFGRPNPNVHTHTHTHTHT